jgi:hypothetical protein
MMKKLITVVNAECPVFFLAPFLRVTITGRQMSGILPE